MVQLVHQVAPPVQPVLLGQDQLVLQVLLVLLDLLVRQARQVPQGLLAPQVLLVALAPLVLLDLVLPVQQARQAYLAQPDRPAQQELAQQVQLEQIQLCRGQLVLLGLLVQLVKLVLLLLFPDLQGQLEPAPLDQQVLLVLQELQALYMRRHLRQV